jgi:hypothetical protein
MVYIGYKAVIIIILLMCVCLCHSSGACHYCSTGLPYGLHITGTGHNTPCWHSVGWWGLTTASWAVGLTCLLKHGGARDNTFLVTHPMTDQRCLTSAISIIELLNTKIQTRHKTLTTTYFSLKPQNLPE